MAQKRKWKFIHMLISNISKIVNNFNIFHLSRWSSEEAQSQTFQPQGRRRDRDSFWRLGPREPDLDRVRRSSFYSGDKEEEGGGLKWDSDFSILKALWNDMFHVGPRKDCFCMAERNRKHPSVIISKSILFWITLWLYEGNCALVNNNIFLTWPWFSY